MLKQYIVCTTLIIGTFTIAILLFIQHEEWYKYHISVEPIHAVGLPILRLGPPLVAPEFAIIDKFPNGSMLFFTASATLFVVSCQISITRSFRS